MKDFFYEVLISPFKNDEIVLGIFSWILLIVVSAIILFGVLCAIDSIHRPIKQSLAVITFKEFIPEHSMTIWTYNAALKQSMPQTTFYADEYVLILKLKEACEKKSVSRELFECVKENETVNVKYSIGRLSGSIYIREVFK